MGFGTTLLNSAISGGDGTPRIEYAPEGVRYTLEVPLSTIAAKAGGNARGIGPGR
jgi:two-component sensor histidine kinase